MAKVRVEFDVPDWAIGSNIKVITKNQLLGYLKFNRKKEWIDGTLHITESYEPVKVKPDNGHCNGCGDCCNTGGPWVAEEWEGIKERVNARDPSPDGPCPMLTDTGCFLKRFGDIPLSCVGADCSNSYENCSEVFIPVGDLQIWTHEVK